MAKKVKLNIDEIEKIDNNVNVKKTDLLKLISIILNAVLIMVIVTVLIVYNNKVNDVKSSMQKKIDSIDTTCAYKTDFSCKLNYSDEIAKAKMLDDNIVFVLEGYGNVYYTYDCVTKLTSGSEYSYWTYNKEAAKSQGYKAGKC